jgi:hypothetical protein
MVCALDRGVTINVDFGPELTGTPTYSATPVPGGVMVDVEGC